MRVGDPVTPRKRSERSDGVAPRITRFVENPVTNLVKGMALLLIGLSEASKTLSDDLVHKQLRVGHGLIIIGAFGILGALPHLIDGLEAGRRYAELRDRKGRPDAGSGIEDDRDK
jgi:hypothetical protein